MQTSNTFRVRKKTCNILLILKRIFFWWCSGEYEEEVGPWPLPKNDFKQNVKFINGIEGVNCVKEQSGALKWFIESAKSKHVAQLIINQHKNNGNGDSYGNGNKPKTHGSKFNCTAPSCFYKDNVTYLQ